MWDFIVGRLAFTVLDVPVKFLIKQEMFHHGLGPILKAMGGIPVDRTKSTNMVEQVALVFDQHESLYIAITPEGTRKLVTNWKKGYYYIAMRANVPVILGFLDYREKRCGLGQVLIPSGDYDRDFHQVEAFYRGRQGKHPERFNLS
ncbi:MAG: 1-acyl-sn-glycerol-3-phosphate acyltransferase, partial [Bacteroidales bacterium]|nr:1-acyl-sn-glycerol-3-phosphate acyltransferase [Bacteroidales bacterium]